MEEGDANGIAAEGEGFSLPGLRRQTPVGTGPYKFGEYDEANGTDHARGATTTTGATQPKSSELVFRVIPDESTRRQELEAGSIDGYDLPEPVRLGRASRTTATSVEVRDPFNIFYLGLNPEAQPGAEGPQGARRRSTTPSTASSWSQTQLPEGAEVATQFMPATVERLQRRPGSRTPTTRTRPSSCSPRRAPNLTLNFAYPTEVTRPYMPDPQQLYDALRTNLEDVGITVEVDDASVERRLPRQRDGGQVRRLPARLDR